MIYRRTWGDWIRMHWVVGVSVKVADNDIRIFRIETTRWWLFAFIHMLIVESKYKNEYPECGICTWLDWKV